MDLRLASVIALAALVGACGGSSPGGPSSTAPRITSISPRAASTAGGALVTINGANFSTGATVSIGGAAATDVAVVDAATLTAVAPAHDAGPADVVVVVNGKSASLPAGFFYVVNALPVISSITIKGTKPREPANFADLDETVSVSATVTDAETPVSQLTFAWSADAGTFSGTGANVTWTAPHTFNTPGDATLKLTVTENFQTANAIGVNTVGTSRKVRVHNSSKEVGDLALDFLSAFSKQVDPAIVMRNFTPACSGTAAELGDVQHNQVDFTITAYALSAPSTTVGFTGRCPFRDRQGDACAFVPADWTSFIKAATYHPDLKPYVGRTMRVTGTDQVTAMLENDQWKLCASDWDQATATIMSREGRAAIQIDARFKQ